MMTYLPDNPYMNQEAENQEESGEDLVEEEVEQVEMGEMLGEKKSECHDGGGEIAG